MRRKTFDAILTAGGMVVTVVLIVAGVLLMWGHNFTQSNVHNQLAEQKIFFPAAGSPALASPEIGPYLNQYAGQQLTTGAQAKAYADHFIRIHLGEISGDRTYAQLSAQSLANPSDTKLANTVSTVFRGETLRGLLLNAYAFSVMGGIAFIASIASFTLAGVMVILSALGVVHLRRTAPEQELLAPHRTRTLTTR